MVRSRSWSLDANADIICKRTLIFWDWLQYLGARLHQAPATRLCRSDIADADAWNMRILPDTVETIYYWHGVTSSDTSMIVICQGQDFEQCQYCGVWGRNGKGIVLGRNGKGILYMCDLPSFSVTLPPSHMLNRCYYDMRVCCFQETWLCSYLPNITELHHNKVYLTELNAAYGERASPKKTTEFLHAAAIN